MIGYYRTKLENGKILANEKTKKLNKNEKTSKLK